MVVLDVKNCIVSNLYTRELLAVDFGSRESSPQLFYPEEDTHLLMEMDMGIHSERKASNLFSVQVISVKTLHHHHIRLSFT